MSLDPARNTDDFLKPKNKSGNVCPLMQKPTCDVCHNCELWQPLEVTVGGKDQVQWRCALVWNAALGVVSDAKATAANAYLVQLRDQFTEFKTAFFQIIAEVARLQAQPRKLEAIDDAAQKVERSPPV